MQTIFLVLALLILAACGGDKTSEHYISRAKGYITQADYPSAAIELQNALQLDDNSAETHWLLGKVFLETRNILTAEKELQRAKELGWKADDIRPALARTLMAQGKYADVLALEYQDLSPSAAALLLSSQTLAALSEKEVGKARELVTLALDKDPLLLEAKLAQATVAVHEGDPTDGLTLVDAILASTPDNGEAWWLRGQALLRKGKLEDARAAYDKSIAHSKIAFADRITRGLINLQLQDYDAAQADATELLKIAPEDPTVNLIQGLLLFQNKEYSSAILALKRAVPVAEQFPLALYYLSASCLIWEDLEPAEKFGREFVELAPDDNNGRKLLASILVLQNKAKDAQQILQPVLDENPDDVAALNIMANALLLDDQADIGMVLYARIAQLQPDWAFVPLRLETQLVTSGSPEDATRIPEIASDRKANFPQTDILQILNHLAKKDFESAIKSAKSYLYLDMKGLAPYRVLGRVYLAAGKPAEARDAFEMALKREPGDPSTNHALAQMALEADDPDKARRHYRTILERHLDDLSTLLQLATLEAAKHNEEAMVATLQEAIRAHPTLLEPRLRLASYYLGSGRPEKVAPLIAALSGLKQRSPRALELTALAQLALQQNHSALLTLQQLVDAKPESVQSHYLLAMAASETGDHQKAKRELLDVIQRDPKYVPALLNLARIAKSEGEREQFERYLATLVELAPDTPDVLRLRALSAQAKGNAAEALVLAQQAFEQAPTTQTVLELTTYQKAAGNKEAARTTLQQWITIHPRDITVRHRLASDLELENDISGAKAQYLAVLEVEPGNVIALNNLAWNMRLDNPNEALEYIRKAAEIAPDHPEVIDTLAVIEGLNAQQGE